MSNVTCPVCTASFSVFVSAGPIAVCPTLGCAATLKVDGDTAQRASFTDVQALSVEDLATIKAERSRVRTKRTA